MTRGIMDAGAIGVAYGRYLGAQKPTLMIKALKAIIRANKGVDEALEILKPYSERRDAPDQSRYSTGH